MNLKDDDANTALHYLVRWKPRNSEEEKMQMEVLHKMADKGIPINARNRMGETALHVSCWHGNNTVVEQLISLGADLNVQNKFETKKKETDDLISSDLILFFSFFLCKKTALQILVCTIVC